MTADRPEDLSFRYFPDNYRWSHGVLIGLNSAPWGGAEIGEINRIGLRLKGVDRDDNAWFEAWADEAAKVERPDASGWRMGVAAAEPLISCVPRTTTMSASVS